MSQNIIIPNKDNKVVLTFAGVDLTLATDIKIKFGLEDYTKLLNPTIVIVDSASQISLDLSSTSEVGQKYITITYFDSSSTNGTDITAQELGNLGRVIVAIGTQLVIEDGTQISNANSFVSDDEYNAYANLKGLSVAATQPQREADLLSAMDYLLSIECTMQGHRANSTQALLFPRNGVSVYGYLLASDKIPQELKNAQMEAAVYSTSSELLTNSSNDNIKSEKVDVLSVEYFSGGSRSRTNLQRVSAQLSVLLKDTDKLVRA